MTVQEYFHIIVARWRVVFAIFSLSVAGGAVATVLATPTYVAKSEVFFSIGVGNNARDIRSGFPYAEGLARSYARVATLPIILGPVKERLALDIDLDDLARSVTARAPADTILVEIVATTSAPQRSSDIANAVAGELAVVIERLSPAGTGRQPSFDVVKVATATAPQFSSTPRVVLNLATSAILGVLAGVVIAIAVETRDAPLRSSRAASDITSAPVIATVERNQAGPFWRRRRLTTPDPAVALGVGLKQLRQQSGARSIMLTCDGDTDMAAVLEALSRIGLRTLVIDTDVRCPSLAKLFGVCADPLDLASILNDGERWGDVVHEVPGSTVAVLPAGSPNMLGVGIETHDAMLRQLVADAVRRYELVFLKAPCVLDAADALVISRLVDGVVLVVDDRRTSQSVLADEVNALQLIGARLLGVILKS